MKRTLNVYNNSPLKLISTCMSVLRQCHSLLESQSSPGPGWYHIYWGNRTPSSPTGSSLGSDPRPGRKSAVLLDLSSLWSYSRDFCIHLSYTEHIWSSFQFHCYIKEMHKIKNKLKQKQFTSGLAGKYQWWELPVVFTGISRPGKYYQFPLKWEILR